MKKDGIEINVTKNGVTKTTHMSIDEWYEETDAQYGIAPSDSAIRVMIEELYGMDTNPTKPKVIQKDLLTQYMDEVMMTGLIDKTPEQVIKDKLFEL